MGESHTIAAGPVFAVPFGWQSWDLICLRAIRKLTPLTRRQWETKSPIPCHKHPEAFVSNQEFIVERARSQALWAHSQGSDSSQLRGEPTCVPLGSLGRAQTLHPSSLHTILCTGGWKQLHGHSWSLCWVGKGRFELLKHFQVLLGTKSPVSGWMQDCTASGWLKPSKIWDISGHVWGELLDSSGTLQSSAPGTV